MGSFWNMIFNKTSKEFRRKYCLIIKPQNMHNKLIIMSFDRKKEEEEKESGRKLSDTTTAKLLSDFIFENQKFQFGERSLTNYYRSANNENEEEVIINRPEVVQALSAYLGYDSFKSFKDANEIINVVKEGSPENSESSAVLAIVKENKLLSTIGIVTIVLLLIYSSTTKHWMVWENDKYIEVDYNLEEYDTWQLKPYDKNMIDNFKKIPVDCNTEFFDPSGKPKIWYGKNAKRELEYFTSFGLHPETGKTLKPISNYMISKYVCNEM